MFVCRGMGACNHLYFAAATGDRYSYLSAIAVLIRRIR
jgi:hypothetical protein